MEIMMIDTKAIEEHIRGILVALGDDPEREAMVTQGGTCRYLTTESEERFGESAQIFLNEKVKAEHVELV